MADAKEKVGMQIANKEEVDASVSYTAAARKAASWMDVTRCPSQGRQWEGLTLGTEWSNLHWLGQEADSSFAPSTHHPPAPSPVTVMDNAPYHSVQKEGTKGANNCTHKADMVKQLEERQAAFEPKRT